MSEGTLRLLGLLTIAGDQDNATVVCFEEPENGVNPRKTKEIAEFLKHTATGDIQVIVTTHSPVLARPDTQRVTMKTAVTRKLSQDYSGRYFPIEGVKSSFLPPEMAKGAPCRSSEPTSIKSTGGMFPLPALLSLPSMPTAKGITTKFGKGCDAPDQKCEKDRYKSLLNDAILSAGGEITISWIEHTDTILEYMDINVLCRADDSARKFIEEVRAAIATIEGTCRHG